MQSHLQHVEACRVDCHRLQVQTMEEESSLRPSPVTRATRLGTCSISLAVALTIALLSLPASVAFAAPANTPAATRLPDSIDAGPIPNAVANDVSCASSGACTAVGSFQDTIGITHAEIFDLTGGTWTASQQLAPVGPPDYTFSDLNSVSCISVGNCVAVGDYRVSTVQSESFYAVEKSGVWARGLALPVPADADNNPAETSFDSVSCLSDGICELIGIYAVAPTSRSAPIHSVIDTYHFGVGLEGSPVELSQLASQQGIDLNSIACTAEGTSGPDCIAVGAQVGAFSEEATYVVESNGSWKSPRVLRNSEGTSIPQEFLSSIACVSTGDCVVAGNVLTNLGQDLAETYSEQGGVWGRSLDIGEPHDMNNPFADDVACTSIDTCTIVGAVSDLQGGLHAATARMTGGRWGQLAESHTPAGGLRSGSEFLGVSCNIPSSCTSVGYFNLASAGGNTEGMAATWTPGLPPGKVKDLRASHVTATQVKLSWQSPASVGSGLSHYEVFATSSGRTTDTGPFGTTSGAVAHLAPGSVDRLTVEAVSTDGQTSPGVSVAVRLPAALPSVPSVARVVGVIRGLYVAWRAPRSTGGAPITSYRVKASCGGVAHAARFSGNARHGTFHGLPAGVRCNVRVAAVNRAGTSPFSPARSGVTR